MRNNTKKGFTLVELLVVIAILAILATVSVVGYTSFIEGAAVRVDGDMATQLNHFLAAYKVNNTGDINEDNIWQVTQEVLELSGVEELNPQAAQYGYHFYYDFKTEQYVSIHNSEALDEDSPLFNFLMAFAEGEESTPVFKLTPGNCFTKGGQYFLVDTTGTNIATAVSGFYSFGLTEEATLEETAAKFEEFCAVIDALPTDAFDSWLNETVFATVNGNFVVDVKGTHKNLIVHREATYITHIKQDVAGLVDDFRANGGSLLTVTEPTTVTVPAGVGVIEGSLYIDGEATVVIAGNSWNMIDKDFTNQSIKFGGSTYTLDATDRSKVVNASGNVVATLKANFLATDFDLALALDGGKATNKANASEGYVALDNLGFTLQLTNFRTASGKSYVGASKSDVEWTIKSVEADEIVEYSNYLTIDANSDDFAQKFAIAPVDGFLPKLDTVVVTASMGGEPKQFVVDVVRITGFKSAMLDGDNILDQIANLVCDTDSNGNPVATNFDLVSYFDYNHDIEGLAIDVSNDSLFELVFNHSHSSECCPHVHKEGECQNYRCSHDCEVEGCPTGECSHLHSENNYACCQHDCETSEACKTLDCTHEGVGAHLGADGKPECSYYCKHLKGTSNPSHTNSCCLIYYYYTNSPEKIAEIHTHSEDCCIGNTYCNNKTNNKFCCKLCREAGHYNNHSEHKKSEHQCVAAGEHEHTMNCCKHVTNKIADHSENCCMHTMGYHSWSEYTTKVEDSKTGEVIFTPDCTHKTDGCNQYCYTIDCKHTHTPTDCDACPHTNGHHTEDCLRSCEHTCVAGDDCWTCDHTCIDDCRTNCTFNPAEPNGNKGLIGKGACNGTLIIKVGKDGAYYTSIEVALNVYAGMETDSNNNVTHLGNSNIVKVEDLFDLADIPEGAVIAIFDADFNPAEDNFMNPSRYLLANKTEAEKDGLAFYVEDNMIERKNDGTWEDIQFYGEGEVYIAVVSGESVEGGKLTGMRLSKDIVANVVVGKNVRDFAELDTTANANNILLADIEMPEGKNISFEGGTLYGNHYTFNIEKGITTGWYIIKINNGTLKDLRIVGALYPEVAIAGTEPYSSNAVYATGTSTIDNCYISNCRTPLMAGQEDDPASVHNITVKNSVLFGGRYANIDLRNGTLTFEGTVMTINQPHYDYKEIDRIDSNDRVAGLGVVVWFEATEAKLCKVNNLVQYNFISENYPNVPDVTIDAMGVNEVVSVKSLFEEIFGDDEKYGDYYFGTNEKYMNASIIIEDLGDLGSFSGKPYGADRVTLTPMPTGYRYVNYETYISTNRVYLHLYGLTDNDEVTDEAQDKLFTASKDAEFIYSPWDHIVGEETYEAYGFGNDNEIIPADLLK